MRGGRSGGSLEWLAWVGAGLLLVLLVPALVRSGELVWSRPTLQLPQHLMMGIGFLAYAVVLRVVAERSDGVPLWQAGVAAAVCFGLAYLALLLRDDVPHSRALVLLSAITGSVAGLLPYLRVRPGAGLLAVGAVAVIALAAALPAYSETVPEVLTRTIETAQHRVTLRHFPALVSTDGDGGALVAHGAGFLLVTGAGRFYRLAWSGDSLVPEPLSLVVPQNREAFLAALSGRAVAPRLRATGIVVDTLADPERVFVAHQYWNDEQSCLTMRVSTTALDDGAGGGWTTVFEANPCLPFAPPYSEWETGGRLAWAPDGSLLLSLGDQGYDDTFEQAVSQQPDNDYGKLLRLDLAGGSEIVSLGHRNPQGLAVMRDGRIWLAEHGPQGGDEVNAIVAGANYGWPLATYGTDYGTDNWPLAPEDRNHGAFAEPAMAFVPALGISALLEIRGDEFPRWDGDLLAGTLRGRQLLRLRTRDDRVLYAEPIALGQRVRDLGRARDGRIVVWTDRGDVLVMARAAPLERGEAVFQGCAMCHRAGQENDGPDLRGVVGREVAASDSFPYTEAMKSLGGRWTRERLDRFLADPRSVVPGTSMWYQVADSADRAALIDYLATDR